MEPTNGASYNPRMGRLLDAYSAVIQVFPHACGLLLVRKVLLGTMLGWEGGQILVLGFLLARVWKRCLQAS